MSDKDKIVHVEPQKQGLKNSPVVNDKLEISPSPAAEGCYWNGQLYGPGASICSAGTIHICQGNGSWWRNGAC